MITTYLKGLIPLAVFAGCTVSALAEQPDQSRRIEQLIHQLEADTCRDRENAHRELVEIGKPAITALRDATKSESPEVRDRAQRVLANLLIEEMQGVWARDNQVLIILGNRWWWGSIRNLRPAEYDKNSFRIVNVEERTFDADLLVNLGTRKGQTCKAIFQFDGDTLYYSGSYEARPTGITNGTGYEARWTRVKGKRALEVLRDAAKHSPQGVHALVRQIHSGWRE